jgi:hypothetical protein
LIAPAIDFLRSLVEDRVVTPDPDARRALIASYVDFVCEHEDLIRVLSQDPSMPSMRVAHEARPYYDRLLKLLAGEEHPSLHRRTRIIAAFGGMRAAILYSAPDADRAVVRDAALVAACGAIGMKSFAEFQ